jgi:hypothetical protein
MSRLVFVSHTEHGVPVRVPVRSGLVLGRTTTPHLALNTRVSRAALFVERVDRARQLLHVMAAVHGRNIAVVRRAGDVTQVATAGRTTVHVGDHVALLLDPVFDAAAPHVFELCLVDDDNDDNDNDDTVDNAADDDVASSSSSRLPANKRRRTSAASAVVTAEVAADVDASQVVQRVMSGAPSVPPSVPPSLPPVPAAERSRDAHDQDDDRSLEILATVIDPLREAMRTASFVQLPLDADPEDAFAPSFEAQADASEPHASFVRADPVHHVDNEQLILCGRRVLLSGSFGVTRALFGASASSMLLCAVDCTVCGKQWCAHFARLLQRLSLRQLSASVAQSAFDFLAGRPRKRRATPLLLNKPELQPMLDRLFGDCDSTLDDSQLSAVARFIDGDRSEGASAPQRRVRVGPVELDYVSGGWRLCGESELLAVGNAAANNLAELYDVTQAFVRGSTAFFSLSRKLDSIVVRCAVSAALGPAGVFGFRCECAGVGVLCEHLCRVLSCVGVPSAVDIGALFHSLSQMTLNEHCGLLARIVMRAKTLGIDRSLVVPLDRLAAATTVLRVNTGALPSWSIAEPGAFPSVLMATQASEADSDVLVATLTRAYRAVSLRISHERLVGAHCDECGCTTCPHVVSAMRDFVFYARGGYGGIAVHATTSVGDADMRAAAAPVLLSYDAIVRTLSQCDLPRRCQLVALAMRDVRQIQSPKVAKRCAQLFADVLTVDPTFPSGAMASVRDFDQCLQALAVVEHMCNPSASLDALCVVSFNFPQRDAELRPLWKAVTARARGNDIYQCVHAGRALLPRPLGVCIVEAALSGLALQQHTLLDESTRQAFMTALYTPGGDVELASRQLLNVPDAVRARAPFQLIGNIDSVDPIGAEHAGITPLFEAAMFLLPGGMIRTPAPMSEAERPSTPAGAPDGRVLTTLLSPADTAALAEARRGMYAPAYSRQEMASMVEKCPADGGVLPVLMLVDVSLRHPFARCAFLEQLRRKLFAHALAQLGFAFSVAMPEEADVGALRALTPLAARALDTMADSMADVGEYSGAETRDIVQATPTVLRKSLLVRMLMSRLALCSADVVQSVFPPFFAWLASHKLYALQAKLAVVYGAHALIEERVKLPLCEHALSALSLAFEADGKRAVSAHFLRRLMETFPARAEVVWAACTRVGQGAMLLEHLLATPTLWPQLASVLVDDDAEARAMLCNSSVQRQLSTLLGAASAAVLPPASFLTRVRELLPEGGGGASSCALLLVRAPDATDEQRKSAIVDLLAQMSDDETVLSQLCALSQDALVLLSQARICEQADRARLAALVLVTTFESASVEAHDMAMFVPEAEALLAKLVARDDFDLLEVLLEARAARFLQFALKTWSPVLVERHARSNSGSRRAFAVECFNRSVGGLLQAALRAAGGVGEPCCRNSRCTECAVCTHLVRTLRRAMVWANLANRVFEFDRARSAVASELTEKRKQKLANVVSSIRNDVELTELDED